MDSQRHNPRFNNAFLLERQQLKDLQTLVEISQGRHDALTLGRLTTRNLGYGGEMIFVREERLPDEEISEMEQFRRWLKEGFAKMFQPEGWRLSPTDPQFAGYSVVLRAGDRPVARYERLEGGAVSGRAAGSLVAWKLAELHRWRLRQCRWAKCGKGFVTRKDSLYCSPRHSQNARTWRLRHDGRNPVAQLDETPVAETLQTPERPRPTPDIRALKAAERQATRVFLRECPKRRSVAQHRRQGREHRIADDGKRCKLLCKPHSLEFAISNQRSRGQVLLAEATARLLEATRRSLGREGSNLTKTL